MPYMSQLPPPPYRNPRFCECGYCARCVEVKEKIDQLNARQQEVIDTKYKHRSLLEIPRE